MTVRRLLVGVAVAAFAVPLLAAAPAQTHQPSAAAAVPKLTFSNERVLARADAPPPAPAASPSAAPAPAATANPAQTAKARAEYDAWAAGTPDMTHYIAGAATKLQAAIPQVQAGVKSVGPLTSFTLERSMTFNGIPVSIYRAAGKDTAAEEMISWDAAGKIQLIFFRPAK